MKNFFSKQIIRTSTNESTNNVVAKIKSVMHQNDILPPKYTTFQSKSEGDSLDAPDDIASILPLTGEIAAGGGGEQNMLPYIRFIRGVSQYESSCFRKEESKF